VTARWLFRWAVSVVRTVVVKLMSRLSRRESFESCEDVDDVRLHVAESPVFVAVHKAKPTRPSRHGGRLSAHPLRSIDHLASGNPLDLGRNLAREAVSQVRLHDRERLASTLSQVAMPGCLFPVDCF